MNTATVNPRPDIEDIKVWSFNKTSNCFLRALPQLVGSSAAAVVLVCGFHKSEVNNLNGRAPPPPSLSISSSKMGGIEMKN